MTEQSNSQIFDMISLMFSISHLGVDVAPQIPTDFLSVNHDIIEFFNTGNKMCIGIYIFTDRIKHLTVGTLSSAYENYYIMFFCEGLEMWFPV